MSTQTVNADLARGTADVLRSLSTWMIDRYLAHINRHKEGADAEVAHEAYTKVLWQYLNRRDDQWWWKRSPHHGGAKNMDDYTIRFMVGVEAEILENDPDAYQRAYENTALLFAELADDPDSGETGGPPRHRPAEYRALLGDVTPDV